MAKNLSNAPGIELDGDYINGKVKNGQTTVGEHVNQDIVQFFQKLLDDAGITPNGNYDNETNGYQFLEALLEKVYPKTATYSKSAANDNTQNSIDASKLENLQKENYSLISNKIKEFHFTGTAKTYNVEDNVEIIISDADGEGDSLTINLPADTWYGRKVEIINLAGGQGITVNDADGNLVKLIAGNSDVDFYKISSSTHGGYANGWLAR